MSDRISILQHSTNVQAKTWELDGSITAHSKAQYFKLIQRTVDGVSALSSLLVDLEARPRCCMIRGTPVPLDVQAIRDQPDPTRVPPHEGFKPGLVRRALDYFDDQPLHAVCLDVDGYQVLTADPLTEPEDSVAEFVTCLLPDAFAGASYHWQLSNTFGHPSKLADGLKVHIWFWLERPLTSAQLKAWAQAAKLPADVALFNPVQVHYTAAPIMADGVECPVQRRHGFVQGPLGDEVELEVDEAALAAVVARQGGNGQRLRNIAAADPIAQRLAGLGLIKSEFKEGYNIECPFAEEHTGESGETATRYFLPHTGGHAVGQFKCLHAHCDGRARSLFLTKIGIDEVEDAFEPMAPGGSDPADAPVTRKGIPEAKHLTTDQANAGRIVKKFGKRMIVVAGQWFAWTGMRWEKDDGEVYRCGCMLSKVIHAEADEWRAKRGATAEETEKYVAISEALVKWAAKSEMKASIEAAVGLTKKMLSVGENTIDRNPWLLNCTNGTVDLRTGELKAHDPDDFITKLAALAYDPTARSDAWETVVARVTLEEGMTTRPLAGFLQRWFGYCATGSTREQAFVVHYGNGSNGKSTILDTVADVLGDYAATAAPGLLVGDKKDRHPTEIADLFGRRMVTSHETGEGGQLKEDMVKQLTGGDKIKARFMRADFFEFDPTHKLQLLTNHKPAIKGQDNGIWRRVLLMPYLARFAVVEEVVAGRAQYVRDTSIMDKLRKEQAGVLAWLVRGAMAWAQEGLQPPDVVLAASRDYQTEQDRIGQFVAECCDLDPTASEPLADGMGGGLYQTYRGWCNEGGVFALSKVRFTQELERCVPGFAKKSTKVSVPGERRRDVLLIQGVRLLQAA